MGNKNIDILKNYGWAILSAFIVVGASASYLHFNQNYDWDCFRGHAEKYCESQNSTLVLKNQVRGEYFYCEKQIDERLGRVQGNKFYFLESEKRECIRK